MTNFRDLKEFPYFVYRHLRKSDGRPFYIGRGKAKSDIHTDYMTYYRAYSSKGRTKLWHRIVDKHGVIVEIILDKLSFEEVCDKEKEFIALYGLSSEGGLLCNFKEGGEKGATSYRHTPETIAKFSANKSIPINIQLENLIYPEPNSGCWLWAGTFSDGHPKINYKNRTLETRRIVYETEHNVKLIPKRETVTNNCGNLHCVNPNHVYLRKSNG